jgi:hypothetical protein
MASTRLTHSARISITLAAINHRFADPERKLAKAEEKLYTALRVSKFRHGTLALIGTIPDGWLPLSSAVRLELEGCIYVLRTAHPQAIPANDSHAVKASGVSKRLVGQINRHVERRERLKAERSKLHGEMSSALKAFSTVESLLKRWPELEPFTKGIERATGNALTVPMADLNKALGIAA